MILNATNLSLGYGGPDIVKNINIEVNKSEIVTIIGPNGSGKSTIIKALSRFLKPREGQVFFENENIYKLNTRIVAQKMAVLPQVKNVPTDFTVEALVSFGRFPHLNFGKRLKKEDYDIIDWAIERTGLKDFRYRYLNMLSGGERQRAWIAMCLAQKPEILILDEPTTFLDISYQLDVLDLVQELNETLGLTIVMVLHDINHAARYSHKIYAIKEGKVHSQGRPQEIVNKEFLKEVFCIDADVFQDIKNSCPYFIAYNIAIRS